MKQKKKTHFIIFHRFTVEVRDQIVLPQYDCQPVCSETQGIFFGHVNSIPNKSNFQKDNKIIKRMESDNKKVFGKYYYFTSEYDNRVCSETQ